MMQPSIAEMIILSARFGMTRATWLPFKATSYLGPASPPREEQQSKIFTFRYMVYQWVDTQAPRQEHNSNGIAIPSQAYMRKSAL